MTDPKKPTIEEFTSAKRRRNQSRLSPYEDDIFTALERGVSQQLIRDWLEDVHSLKVAHSTLHDWIARRRAVRAKAAAPVVAPEVPVASSPIPNSSPAKATDLRTPIHPAEQDTSELKSADKSQSRNAVKAVPESQPTTVVDPYAESMAIVNKGLLSK